MTIATDGRARARDLADSLQVAAVVGALVVLALPWSTEWKVNDAITSTGWGALNDSTEGYPWFVIVVVAAGVTATILDRRWARRVAAWAASFIAVGMTARVVEPRPARRLQGAARGLDRRGAGRVLRRRPVGGDQGRR